MKQPRISPFDSIESAHDFVTLLSLTIDEARRELSADIERESTGPESRRLDALRMALYNLEKLEAHLSTSGRLLNDLRSIRRLLCDERGGPVSKLKAGALDDKTLAVTPGPKNGHGVAAA